MFKPNFRYTNRIVTLIGKIAASREVVLNSPLVPKWEVSLRREAMVRSAHSSTSIEGNKLTLDQVSKLAEGRNIMASRKDKQEVLNYLNVLERLDAFVEDGKTISEKIVLRIHKNSPRIHWMTHPIQECTGRSTSLLETVSLVR